MIQFAYEIRVKGEGATLPPVDSFQAVALSYGPITR